MFAYRNNDVHTITPEIKFVLDTEKEWRYFISEYAKRTTWEDTFEGSKTLATNQNALMALEKINRMQSSIDPDTGIDVRQILQASWYMRTKVDDESNTKFYLEVLEETNMTCIQGDSHRLFQYFYATWRSLEGHNKWAEDTQEDNSR